MLPELFKVGSTMQEDFGFFSTSSCLNDKVVTSSGNSSAPVFIDFDSTSQTLNKEAEIVVSDNNNSPEINKWPFNYGINFLKTSDDPMISSVHQESGCNENELLKRNSCNTESSSSPKPSFNEITSSEDPSYVSDVLIKPNVDSNRRLNLHFHNQLFSQDQYSNFESNHLSKSHEKTRKIVFRSKKESSAEAQSKEEGVITWLQKMMLKTKHDESNKKKNELKSAKVPDEESFCKDNNPSLPYMGQMTLENMKPRRGRKPKKADICHLIYKNYGTIIPKSAVPNATTGVLKLSLPNKSTNSSSGKIQHETKNKPVKEPKISQTEPLNLCVREKLKRNSTIKEQLNLVSDTEIIGQLIETKEKFHEITSTIVDVNGNIGKFVIENDEKLSLSQQKHDNVKKRNITVHINTAQPENASEFQDYINLESSSPDPSSTTPSTSFSQHQKRKRSAIFIPPVQTECSTSNPTNEVSICKFKFTGGTKPSLQEKKILSVDAGGNFRYFSGTGDKSMRGYEFFPRENLLKSSMSAQSHTNAFLNAASQKLPLDILPPISPDINNKLLNLSDVDSTGILDKNFIDDSETCMSDEKNEIHPDSVMTVNRRRPVLNRSVQRRKLEKTFKEKGFLIQTQQLQSAEGATYCKFRQLRKFTRYLFRSWKDYLPPCEAKPDT